MIPENRKIVVAFREKGEQEVVWVTLKNVDSLEFIAQRLKNDFNDINSVCGLVRHGDIEIITSTGVLVNNSVKNRVKKAASLQELTDLLDNHETNHIFLYDCEGEKPEWVHWTFFQLPEPKE